MKLKKSTKKAAANGRLAEAIIKYLSSAPERSFNYKQISAALGICASDRYKVLDALQMLEDEDSVVCEPTSGKYSLKQTSRNNIGTIDRSDPSKIYFIPDDASRKVHIAEKATGGALHGDRVEVAFIKQKRRSTLEAEVVKIVARARETFVGILETHGSAAFLVVDRKYLPNDIFIPKEKLHGAKNNDRCIAKITNGLSQARNPEGEIVDVLGAVGNNNAEMHAILAEFDLPYSYPADVEKAADEISDTIDEQEIARRRDMRADTTFTIDPVDAKDFDDALSIMPAGDGLWRVGVHIADVTHYVTPDSIIETEAYNRATSVYLVDRTVPMLPERLCNKICSLRPDEDKLTYSVVYTIDDKAQIQNYEICRTVTRSNRRFTYEEAQKIIETGEGEYAAELLKLNELAKTLRDQRFAHGAIAFERTEVRFNIDENGKPLSVYFKEAKEANKLIEEFMLLANQTVAAHIGKKMKHASTGTAPTFVYRVHDNPNPDKISQLGDFVKRLGLKFRTDKTDKVESSTINKLLTSVQGKPYQNLIETLAVRAMAKAIYTTTNIGHYGLSIDYYTHFTSPIRRYPDMMVHRLLTHYMNGGKSVDTNEYEERCEHSSDMEQTAAAAERASIKYKQVEFMNDKIGQVYDAVISGVAEWGLYAELNENKCEGLVPIRTLGDDYYIYDADHLCIVGRHHGKQFTLGDSVTVRVVSADLIKKQLDFELV